MPYSNLSDDYYDRTEFLRLSRSALAMTTEAQVFASRSQTNGFIPREALRRLTTSPDPESDATELVNAGVWELLPDGWQIPWNNQRTADQVAADRERDRIRKAHSRGNHSDCPSYYTCKNSASGSDSRKESRSESHKESAGQPNPIQPNPKEQGLGLGKGQNLGSTPSPSGGARPEPAPKTKDDQNRAPQKSIGAQTEGAHPNGFRPDGTPWPDDRDLIEMVEPDGTRRFETLQDELVKILDADGNRLDTEGKVIAP